MQTFVTALQKENWLEGTRKQDFITIHLARQRFSLHKKNTVEKVDLSNGLPPESRTPLFPEPPMATAPSASDIGNGLPTGSVAVWPVAFWALERFPLVPKMGF